MELKEYIPVWDRLAKEDQECLAGRAFARHAPAGKVIYNGSMDCLGLMAIRSGQLRAYILSPEGRQVTLHRLTERDICLFSASCIMHVQFEITIEAEKDTDLWVVPAESCKQVMERSAALSNFINQIMAERLSSVMWLVEQVMWKSLDKRLAAFLLEERRLEDTPQLKITHEKIGNHMGTAREVITRMLKYFQSEGLVKLTRGGIELLDEAAVRALAGE